METTPTVTVKRKNIAIITDYCLDNKVEFTVKHKRANEEYDIEFVIENITRAIAFGMFLRENKFMLNGMEPAAPAAQAKSSKKGSSSSAEAKEKLQNSADETLAGLSFEENDLQLDLAN